MPKLHDTIMALTSQKFEFSPSKISHYSATIVIFFTCTTLTDIICMGGAKEGGGAMDIAGG